MLHCPSDYLCNKILTYRKNRFLDYSKGFVCDVFNICIKYKLMNIWHGVAPLGRLNRLLNPLHFIKKVIISHNLRVDLNEGRTRKSTFSKIYLVNPFVYQEKYQILEPFTQENCFSTSNGGKRFVKALLHPASYLENCTLCGVQHSDICDHLLTSCPRTPHHRKKLRLKLILYNYPIDKFPLTKESIFKNALGNKAWRKCPTDFLIDVDY